MHSHAEQHGETRCVITVKTSPKLPFSRRSRTVARKRGPRKDLIDVVVGETELAEFLSKNDEKESEEISEDFKNVVGESSNIETQEMFMITDTIQCQTFTTMKLLQTHVAHVDRQIQEQVAKLRKKFSNTSWTVSKNIYDVCVFRIGKPIGKTIGRIEGFQLYHKARDHLQEQWQTRCLVDILKTDDTEYIFGRKISPKKK